MNQNTKDAPATFTAQMSEFLGRNANWLLAGGSRCCCFRMSSGRTA